MITDEAIRHGRTSDATTTNCVARKSVILGPRRPRILAFQPLVTTLMGSMTSTRNPVDSNSSIVVRLVKNRRCVRSRIPLS